MRKIKYNYIKNKPQNKINLSTGYEELLGSWPRGSSVIQSSQRPVGSGSTNINRLRNQ